MKKLIILLLSCILLGSCKISQKDSSPSFNISAQPVGSSVTEFSLPQYSGGGKAILSYIGTNVTYPKIAAEQEIEEEVIESFVIDKAGNITRPELKQSANFYLDKEAIKVVQSIEKVIPGTDSAGNPIDFYLQTK